MSDIRGLLFDKDGTLLDFNATWLPFARAQALKAAGGNEALASALLVMTGYDPRRGTFLPGSVMAAGSGRQVTQTLYPHLSGRELDIIVARLDRDAAAHLKSYAVMIGGASATLRTLHAAGYALGIATNDSEHGAHQSLEVMGVGDLFAGVLGYDSVANPKPAPDMLHAFAEATGLEPHEIAVIGDNSHDLDMARAGEAGLAIGVLSGNGTREALEPLADVILASVADLPAHLGVI
ncbi:MAG: HAD family hydrolase [Brucellaceae bacterium]|nr:HAD family hydrolase [Brucellaceae bacterium]